MSVSSAASESSTGQFAPVGITLLSSAFAGLAPLFGKLAYRAQVDPYTLVALRTLIAAAALWAFYGLFWRKYLHISRANLVGCIGMGLSNGIGSLLYYTGLARIDASLAHLLYSMYPVWVFVFLSAAGHPVGRLALLRLMLALGAIFLLTWTGTGLVDLLGVMLMIGAGACYGWHVVLGQWTLADVDSRTVTLYVLSTMATQLGTNLGPGMAGHRAAGALSHRAGAALGVRRPAPPGRLSDHPARGGGACGRGLGRVPLSRRTAHHPAVAWRRALCHQPGVVEPGYRVAHH
jgi:drug/metabolite transporter (DMT)-like permease